MNEYDNINKMYELQKEHEILKTAINGQLHEINNKLDAIITGEGVNCARHSMRIQNLESDIDEINSNISWLWKSILGAILSAVGVFVFRVLVGK